MLRKVTLHGALAEYGGPYRLDVKTAAEAVYALTHQFPPAFLKMFLEGSYFVELKQKPMEALDELMVPGPGDIDIYPAIMAAGGGGGGKGKSIGMIVAGTILVAVAVIATGGVAGFGAAAAASTFGGLALSAAASIGTGLILSGVTGLLSPVPKMAELSKQREAKEGSTNSFLYHGPVNREAEGGPVPLVYGRCIIGSIRIGGGTIVTSSISEGRELIDLSAVPIGGYAFNFTLVDDTRISTGGGIEMFVWERKDKGTVDTLWDWEIRMSWDGGPGTHLPNESYLKTGMEIKVSDGETHYGAFSNDDYRDYNGPISRTHRFWIETGGRIFSHSAYFHIVGDEDMDIIMNSFYSRLKRVA